MAPINLPPNNYPQIPASGDSSVDGVSGAGAPDSTTEIQPSGPLPRTSDSYGVGQMPGGGANILASAPPLPADTGPVGDSDTLRSADARVGFLGEGNASSNALTLRHETSSLPLGDASAGNTDTGTSAPAFGYRKAMVGHDNSTKDATDSSSSNADEGVASASGSSASTEADAAITDDVTAQAAKWEKQAGAKKVKCEHPSKHIDDKTELSLDMSKKAVGLIKGSDGESVALAVAVLANEDKKSPTYAADLEAVKSGIKLMDQNKGNTTSDSYVKGLAQIQSVSMRFGGGHEAYDIEQNKQTDGDLSTYAAYNPYADD
jgi:hypothetical protein